MAKQELPKWDHGSDYVAGLKAYELAQEFKASLEPRLPSGLLEGLKEDLDKLALAGDESKSKVAEVKGFTGTRAQAIDQSVLWCSTTREALKRAQSPADVKKAAGVGTAFSRTRSDGVVASVRAVLDAYDRFPDAFRAAGVLPVDMEAGKQLANALTDAEMAQETAKVRKTQTTAMRNALRKRIEAAVDRIRGAGLLQYRTHAPTATRFAALVPNHGNGGSKEKPAPAPAAKN